MTAGIIIPARWASTRFPGKPLARINGKPLIEWTVQAARRTELPVYVATDDARIAEVARWSADGVIMTGDCANGTERCAEAMKLLPYDVIVNWQGDSPAADPAIIPALIARIEDGADVATPVMRSTEIGQRMLDDATNGRVGGTGVVCADTRALYFSKRPIPYGAAPEDLFFHVGIYAYSRAALERYGTTTTPLESAEKLEQLRFIESGIAISVVEIQYRPIWEVNNPEDVAIVECLLLG